MTPERSLRSDPAPERSLRSDPAPERSLGSDPAPERSLRSDPAAPPAAADPAELIADAVLAVPGVAGLHGGMFGEVATYLPGRRVLGVALGENSCDVHISVRYPSNVVETAARVRAALAPMVGLPVDVTVEDVLTEGTSP